MSSRVDFNGKFRRIRHKILNIGDYQIRISHIRNCYNGFSIAANIGCTKIMILWIYLNYRGRRLAGDRNYNNRINRVIRNNIDLIGVGLVSTRDVCNCNPCGLIGL